MDSPASLPAVMTPVPDPTLLTTQQLIREIGALREILEARMDGIDRLQGYFQTELARVAPLIDLKVGHMSILQDQRFATVDERFRSIQVQFQERDIRTEQTNRDSKVAIDAALQAAKESVLAQNTSSALAISKSEAATTKQIDQQSQLIQTMTQTLDGKIGDLKDRLTLIEGKSTGKDQSWMVIVAVFSALLGLGGLAISLLR